MDEATYQKVRQGMLQWSKRATAGVKESEMFVSLFSTGIEKDPVPMLQLGYAVFLGKPLFLTVPESMRGQVSPHLVKIAEAILYYPDGHPEAIHAELAAVLKNYGIEREH
jgi:hypothetical protein